MNNDSKKYILIIEDDESLASWIADYLIDQNFLVGISNRGDQAVELIKADSPDLVLLDINLPAKDGFDICREVRSFYHKPILIMTARDDEFDEVLGLELGADDYVTKPIRARALLARIKSLLRRNEIESQDADLSQHLDFGRLTIDLKSRSVRFDNQILDISSNEFNVLWVLASQEGVIVSRETLIKELRGIEYDGFDRSTDILVSRLRKKLSLKLESQQVIKTVWGKGYLFLPKNC